MRPSRHPLALAVLCAVAWLAGRADAANWMVTTTADAGAGSLREALVGANVSSDADTIEFAIGAPGTPATIAVTSALPDLTNPVTIDGTTSPAGRVIVTGSVAIGFSVTGGAATIRGLVVNGFTSACIKITGGTGSVIEGNFIGTNAAGTASATPSSSTGVWITGSGGNRVGGWTAAARNLISGSGTGVFFSGSFAIKNVVVGNWIGTNATGNAALANTGSGIESFLGSPNTIGGADSGAGNVISGNGQDGIALGLSGSVGYDIQGNAIGVGADGVTPVPNGRHGIRLLSHMTNSRVGGDAPNHIAYNVTTGVVIALTADAGNAILGNSIHDNGSLGIDINGTGVNANDTLDVDTGSNDGQNFPVLDGVFPGGDSVDGTLDSAAGTAFTIQVFANPACDSNGYGEGKELVGSVATATDVTGHAAFTVPLSRTVAASEFLTATATDANGSTSEFSRCVPLPVTTTTSTSTSTSTSKPSTSSTSTSTAAPTTTSTSSSSSTSSIPSTTSSSTTVVDTTTTSSSTVMPVTTTSTTDVAATSSTSSTTLAEAITTSTTESPASSTTSTTASPATSSTSSSTLDPTTTSSTSSSSTSSTLGAPITSTTSDPTTSSTSSTTLAVSTTTSTSVPTTSSTSSTTLPGATSSTSSSSSTSTSDTSTTSPTSSSTSSTTLAGSTTSSTSSSSTSTSTDTTTTSPTSSTTSTSTTSTSTSSTTSSSTSTSTSIVATTSTTSTTTVHPISTTSTTLPAGCGTAVAFEPLRCRLVDLTTTVDGASALAAMRPKLDRHLGKARALFDKADARCRLAKKGPAKKSLRMTKKRLAMLGKALHGKPARSLPTGVTEPIMRRASALGADVLTLSRTIVCH